MPASKIPRPIRGIPPRTSSNSSRSLVATSSKRKTAGNIATTAYKRARPDPIDVGPPTPAILPQLPPRTVVLPQQPPQNIILPRLHLPTIVLKSEILPIAMGEVITRLLAHVSSRTKARCLASPNTTQIARLALLYHFRFLHRTKASNPTDVPLYSLRNVMHAATCVWMAVKWLVDWPPRADEWFKMCDGIPEGDGTSASGVKELIEYERFFLQELMYELGVIEYEWDIWNTVCDIFFV